MGDFLVLSISIAAWIAAAIVECPFPLQSTLGHIWLRQRLGRPIGLPNTGIFID